MPSNEDESSRRAPRHEGHDDWEHQHDRRVLDPREGTFAGLRVLSTAYSGSQLTLLRSSDRRRVKQEEAIVDSLRKAADELDWTLKETEDPRTRDLPVGIRILTLSSRPGWPAPDPWRVLQLARANAKKGRQPFAPLAGAVLDHTISPMGSGRFQPNTVFHEPNPVFHEPNPVFHEPNPASGMSSAAVATYLSAGSGGRQPIAYVGEAPTRRPDDDYTRCRRPVVAMLDTGVWAGHPWFVPAADHRGQEQEPVVRTDVRLKGRKGESGRIGLGHIAWQQPGSTGPLDGALSGIAGHGTFVAGLILQKCPDATILSWRVVPPDGEMEESELLIALCQILELVRTKQQVIDVLNLSLSYYHETPDATELLDATLRTLLDDLGRAGVTVVCSVGNDATSRPAYPAAFGPWERDSEGNRPWGGKSSIAPIVATGALNPSGHVDALFSNVGRWVRHYERGAAVMSTFPRVQGGYQPMARTWVDVAGDRRVRSSMDPDDYRSGFAVWSGTSFAAPIAAGRVATELHGRQFGKKEMPTAKMAWEAVTKVTHGQISLHKDA